MNVYCGSNIWGLAILQITFEANVCFGWNFGCEKCNGINIISHIYWI